MESARTLSATEGRAGEVSQDLWRNLDIGINLHVCISNIGAVKLKLPWISQDVRDDKSVGYLPRKTTNRD